MTNRVLLHRVIGKLPEDISALRSDAAHEGYRFIERLIDEWEADIKRFDKPDEALLVARHDRMIAGIGGVTEDPSDHTALRMRRFYVRPAYRRCGVARELATALIAEAIKTGRPLFVNAGTEAAPLFWESMGFSPIENPRHTHVWPKTP